jgi:hypothetical protein
MIKKAINKIKKVFIPEYELETQTSLLHKKAEHHRKVECAIDDEVVPCSTFSEVFYSPEAQGTWENTSGYTGVPAPAYLEDDPWFGPAPVRTKKQLDYMEQETKIKEEEKRFKTSCESHDIHQRMYEIATKNWNTVGESQGGSENFQEGPGGWNSGNGFNQFYK